MVEAPIFDEVLRIVRQTPYAISLSDVVKKIYGLDAGSYRKEVVDAVWMLQKNGKLTATRFGKPVEVRSAYWFVKLQLGDKA